MKKIILLAASAAAGSVVAQDSNLSNPSISGVLDGYYQSADRALGGREEGFGLGENELAISASIDDMFYGKLTTILAVSDGETELELEEAFIQTTAMADGFSIRAGRFLSDVGYLNNQHLHSDSFIDRPGAYRAFMGGHYFDDGLRFNYLAPTDLYWNIGVELFDGGKMQAEGVESPENLGVINLMTKLGGDIGVDRSWQFGLAWSHNQNAQGLVHEDEHNDEQEGEQEDEHADHDEAHGHNHNISYLGENMLIADFVYKWAPDGNYKYNHFTLSGEYFYLEDITPLHDEEEHDEEEHDEEEHSPIKDTMSGWYLSAVYQISTNWSTGLRYGETNTLMFEGEHADEQKLKETELMLAWHNSHFSKVTLQYTRQRAEGFDSVENDNIVSLQYVMTLGAHNAHQY